MARNNINMLTASNNRHRMATLMFYIVLEREPRSRTVCIVVLLHFRLYARYWQQKQSAMLSTKTLCCFNCTLSALKKAYIYL